MTMLQLKTNIKSYVAYRMLLLRVTFSDLESLKVTFVVWNLCVHPPRWFCIMVRWRSKTRWRQQHWWQSALVDHSYGPVDTTKIGCTEVCW